MSLRFKAFLLKCSVSWVEKIFKGWWSWELWSLWHLLPSRELWNWEFLHIWEFWHSNHVHVIFKSWDGWHPHFVSISSEDVLLGVLLELLSSIDLFEDTIEVFENTILELSIGVVLLFSRWVVREVETHDV